MLDSPTLSAFFDANPWQLYLLLGVLGLLVGSFLNVVILRLPEVMRREWTRDCRALLELDTSDTPSSRRRAFLPGLPRLPLSKLQCGDQALAEYSRSELAAPARALRLLRQAIGLRYPLVELFTAIATVTVGVYTGWSIALPAYLLLTWALVALAGIDIDTQLLPDDITLPLLWGGLLFNLFLGPVAIADAVLGAAGGYLLLWSIYWLFKLVTGKEGMGFGDFKLLAALGAWLGWQALPGIILLSSAVGAVLGLIILALRGQGRSQPLPFGPYLAAAGWISLLWGHQISALFFHSV
jgi:leader peptidase (prepilin peptidase)/N-methyltransferase